MSETIRNLIHVTYGFILFPGTVLGLVPWLLVDRYGYRLPHPTDVGYWFAKVLLPGGLVVMLWTVALFFVYGRGTPVPWAPPKRLVVVGPYKYVRNPMMLGVAMMLLGESLIISSWPIAIWWAFFCVAAHLGVTLWEEPGLKKRFGQDYALYCQNVRRWIPGTEGWTAPWQADDALPRDPAHKDHWEGYQPPAKDD